MLTADMQGGNIKPCPLLGLPASLDVNFAVAELHEHCTFRRSSKSTTRWCSNYVVLLKELHRTLAARKKTRLRFVFSPSALRDP